jgi:hypothetical protein
MATLTTPRWSPDPVSALPIATTITFTVTPGPFAGRGIQVEYELSAPRARFEAFTGSPPLPTEESNMSLPQGTDKSCAQATSGLAACTRGAFRIVDRYPGATDGTSLQITRVLRLEALEIGLPALARIKVSVSDVTTSGVFTLPRSKLATITI